jgi:hypothetical protein
MVLMLGLSRRRRTFDLKRSLRRDPDGAGEGSLLGTTRQVRIRGVRKDGLVAQSVAGQHFARGQHQAGTQDLDVEFGELRQGAEGQVLGDSRVRATFSDDPRPAVF